MKILTFGIGAFGFAVLKHIGENNQNKEIYAYEKDTKISSVICATRKHPFFHTGFSLPENIKILDDYKKEIRNIDMVILAIPAQYIKDLLDTITSQLPSGVIFVNLAKGIDIKNNKTIFQLLQLYMKGKCFHYCIFSGGIFASELIAGKVLGADLGVTNRKIGNEVKKILESRNLNIRLKEDYINIELCGSFKNICALVVGYYHEKGEGLSSISYYIFVFIEEFKELIELYGGEREKFDFASYSLGGDLITTCFGDSRNRYLGRLLGAGKSIQDALSILKAENKHAEGYETLKAVYKKIENKRGFDTMKFFYNLIKYENPKF